jgi:hypothetical protein
MHSIPERLLKMQAASNDSRGFFLPHPNSQPSDLEMACQIVPWVDALKEDVKGEDRTGWVIESQGR